MNSYFETGQLILKYIFPHQEKYKGKFAINFQVLYVVFNVLSLGSLTLSEVDDKE